jgi:hypothetical protein|tara:strand:+ start:268 stop:480 length:213 start_codon:yes stop_codon:yes gene_type:complete
MIIKNNKSNRTHYVYAKYGKVETFISTPHKNAKRGTRLTVRSGAIRLDLNGRQVRTLAAVLNKARQLSSK